MRRTESLFLSPDTCFYDLVCELCLHFSSIWPYRVYAPHSSVKGLPGLPVQKLLDIIASGNKSEQERTPRDRCS